MPCSSRVSAGHLFPVLLLALGCQDQGPQLVRDSGPTEVARGAEFTRRLRTVGPGHYEAPPALSTGAVRFLDADYATPVPAGATQDFRFKAVSAGRVLITYHHTESQTLVVDTVDVR